MSLKVQQDMKTQVTYHRKLSGTAFLVIRILFDLMILSVCLFKLYPVKFDIMSCLFLLMTLFDAVMCTFFLLFPSITCTGNGYIKCLPFALNSYLSNVIVFYVKIDGVGDHDKRVPYIAAFNIISLFMYGGLASPLNLAWMETFKPFSTVILKNRRLSMTTQESK